jgi:hypothetical protein
MSALDLNSKIALIGAAVITIVFILMIGIPRYRTAMKQENEKLRQETEKQVRTFLMGPPPPKILADIGYKYNSLVRGNGSLLFPEFYDCGGTEELRTAIRFSDLKPLNSKMEFEYYAVCGFLDDFTEWYKKPLSERVGILKERLGIEKWPGKE